MNRKEYFRKLEFSIEKYVNLYYAETDIMLDYQDDYYNISIERLQSQVEEDYYSLLRNEVLETVIYLVELYCKNKNENYER